MNKRDITLEPELNSDVKPIPISTTGQKVHRLTFSFGKDTTPVIFSIRANDTASNNKAQIILLLMASLLLLLVCCFMF
jgi:hypothetical protein